MEDPNHRLRVTWDRRERTIPAIAKTQYGDHRTLLPLVSPYYRTSNAHARYSRIRRFVWRVDYTIMSCNVAWEYPEIPTDPSFLHHDYSDYDMDAEFRLGENEWTLRAQFVRHDPQAVFHRAFVRPYVMDGFGFSFLQDSMPAITPHRTMTHFRQVSPSWLQRIQDEWNVQRNRIDILERLYTKFPGLALPVSLSHDWHNPKEIDRRLSYLAIARQDFQIKFTIEELYRRFKDLQGWIELSHRTFLVALAIITGHCLPSFPTSRSMLGAIFDASDRSFVAFAKAAAFLGAPAWLARCDPPCLSTWPTDAIESTEEWRECLEMAKEEAPSAPEELAHRILLESFEKAILGGRLPPISTRYWRRSGHPSGPDGQGMWYHEGDSKRFSGALKECMRAYGAFLEEEFSVDTLYKELVRVCSPVLSSTLVANGESVIAPVTMRESACFLMRRGRQRGFRVWMPLEVKLDDELEEDEEEWARRTMLVEEDLYPDGENELCSEEDEGLLYLDGEDELCGGEKHQGVDDSGMIDCDPPTSSSQVSLRSALPRSPNILVVERAEAEYSMEVDLMAWKGYEGNAHGGRVNAVPSVPPTRHPMGLGRRATRSMFCLPIQERCATGL
ncbi:uncharacterized protein EI90DRAFT_2158302 [Cantharellus anzutake]|uniref:uncharacterized protein n=1 Tax=Cantharellus anzutake TaxID=1750568 RepID=UPI0019062F77|nr:uncharacterized protein EI90DRAFT_2158302 [Cantharellus anzutake]KAF8325334.1 hypothetical protein EI90DRAFT_2158302 [Cantharellus anzutake]